MSAFTAGALVRPLGHILSVRIDPQWPHRQAWRAAQGREGARSGAAQDGREFLPFTFVDLSGGISENAAVNYAETEVVGRAEGHRSFIGTSNREFALTFFFQAQGNDRADLRETLLQEVRRPALWMEGLKYPVRTPDGVNHAPPPVIVTLGELYIGRCIVTDSQLTWKEPFDPDTFLPFGAEVAVTFTQVTRDPYRYEFGRSRLRGASDSRNALQEI